MNTVLQYPPTDRPRGNLEICLSPCGVSDTCSILLRIVPGATLDHPRTRRPGCRLAVSFYGSSPLQPHVIVGISAENQDLQYPPTDRPRGNGIQYHADQDWQCLAVSSYGSSPRQQHTCTAHTRNGETALAVSSYGSSPVQPRMLYIFSCPIHHLQYPRTDRPQCNVVAFHHPDIWSILAVSSYGSSPLQLDDSIVALEESESACSILLRIVPSATPPNLRTHDLHRTLQYPPTDRPQCNSRSHQRRVSWLVLQYPPTDRPLCNQIRIQLAQPLWRILQYPLPDRPGATLRVLAEQRRLQENLQYPRSDRPRGNRKVT